MSNVTLCIPSIRKELALGTLMTANNQSHPPLRSIMYDVSDEGLDPLSFAGFLAGYLKMEVHRGEIGTQQVPAQRYLAEQATTEWLWFVDDDAWPWHDALEQMLACADRTGAALVGGTRVDLDQYIFTDPYSHPHDYFFSGPSQDMRPKDNQVFTLDGISFLVKREAFLECDLSYVPDKSLGSLNGGGPDFFVTSQISAKHLSVVASKALILHLQWYLSSSSGWPKGVEWFDKYIKPKVTDEEYDRLLNFTRLRGRPPEVPDWKRSYYPEVHK